MRKILIVDDEAELVRLLQMYLGLKGYTVEAAVDGEEALEKNRSFQPRVVLLDLIMPGKGGFDVLKQIKHANPETEVIVITAMIEEQVRALAMQLGAHDCIVKPFNLDRLEKSIGSFFAEQPSPSAKPDNT
ncbi:response regulator transcription factor [Desulfonatronum sp. SC1]|uniref:response regulator transcription factor n=1 Tax=Desulfonatronum sp. SC1 TaxID=2109626 RepID=UPI000D31AFC1|nr:response regulator [Desulfonatronum sp. SC1]PTN37728.1 hypothetical protein C6366_05670 [Desulfonatronum sp. SC1]